MFRVKEIETKVLRMLLSLIDPFFRLEDGVTELPRNVLKLRLFTNGAENRI